MDNLRNYSRYIGSELNHDEYYYFGYVIDDGDEDRPLEEAIWGKIKKSKVNNGLFRKIIMKKKNIKTKELRKILRKGFEIILNDLNVTNSKMEEVEFLVKELAVKISKLNN